MYIEKDKIVNTYLNSIKQCRLNCEQINSPQKALHEIMVAKNNIYLMLDIDDVLATPKQYYSNRKNWHPNYNCYKFDEKCVNVFNQILEEIRPIKPIIILSSDWGKKYSLDELNEIFKWNNAQCTITDVTPSLWNAGFKKLQELELCRASEILKYVKEHNVQKFIVIDDLDLSPWFENNFVHIKRANEGIKQCGIKEKIIKQLKFNYEHFYC